MITVKLSTAKKLRDLGFSQNSSYLSWWSCDGWREDYIDKTSESAGDAPIAILAAAPTSSELWEAIRKLSPDQDVHVETVHGVTEATAKATSCSWDDCEWVEGENLQEALANLWIHLQSKK